MKFRFTCIIILLFLTACTTNNSNSQHPYVNVNTSTVINDKGALKQRIILLGDAGLSSITPLQASLAKAIVRAKLSPDKTSVIMLGDNIYPSGFPNKTAEQQSFNDGQLKQISYLTAQLQIAKQSGAEMFMVPGNHDWYASQLDTQAAYIKNYAAKNQLSASLVPYQKDALPLPKMINKDGISIIFLDTMWLIHAEPDAFNTAMDHLAMLLAKSAAEYPDNVILLSAHHPIESMGPHGGYYSHFGHQTYEAFVQFFTPNHQDISSPKYQRLINKVNSLLAPYSKTIFSAGHDHSLQVFKNESSGVARYNLVSGAANQRKLSGVGYNENSQFALSQEGFIELEVLANGTLLSVYDSRYDKAVYQQWLWQSK